MILFVEVGKEEIGVVELSNLPCTPCVIYTGDIGMKLWHCAFREDEMETILASGLSGCSLGVMTLQDAMKKFNCRFGGEDDNGDEAMVYSMQPDHAFLSEYDALNPMAMVAIPSDRRPPQLESATRRMGQQAYLEHALGRAIALMRVVLAKWGFELLVGNKPEDDEEEIEL